MRRPTRLGLWIAVLVLVACGAYSAYWFIVADRIEAGVREWAGSLPVQNLELSWQTLQVRGFPFGFRAELVDARLRERGAGAAGEAAAPLLVASASPWNLFLWRLAAPNGLTAAAGPTDSAIPRASARTATGSVAVASGGGGTLWLGLGDITVEAGLQLAASAADVWLNLPPRPPTTHSEAALGIAIDLRGLSVPVVPPPLRNPVDEVAFGATVMGAFPPGPPRRAAAAWRDSGGTLELEHFALRWGQLVIKLSGTLALDGDLQPMAAFSGALEGPDELLAALVAAGRLRSRDADLTRLALRFLARPGPDGRPEIATSFTIQNGEMYLGPARLGPAPRIEW